MQPKWPGNFRTTRLTLWKRHGRRQPQNHTIPRISNDHSLRQLWRLWDHSFLSCVADTHTDTHTDRRQWALYSRDCRWCEQQELEAYLIVAFTKKLELLCLLVHEHAVQVASFDGTNLNSFVTPAHDLTSADVRYKHPSSVITRCNSHNGI